MHCFNLPNTYIVANSGVDVGTEIGKMLRHPNYFAWGIVCVCVCVHGWVRAGGEGGRSKINEINSSPPPQMNNEVFMADSPS